MRRFIFKSEIKKIFLEDNTSSGDQNNIITCLFQNIDDIDSSKQYFLKKEFKGIGQLEIELNSKLSNNELIQAVKNIFVVDDDLHIPLDLKNKILKNEPVAVFIGAGVSKLRGYPLWDELANNAIRFLLDNNYIDHFEEQRLLYEIKDPKQKLSIFDKFCSRKLKDGKEFYKLNIINKPNSKSQENPYDYIVSEEFNWLKMTSNIDYELRDSMRNFSMMPKPLIEVKADIKPSEEKLEIISKDFDPFNIKADALYYLHGKLDDIENVVFTTEDYIKNYFDKDGTINQFLTEIFAKYTVVFIGYGLEEFPILEPILKKNKTHYALISTYLNEMNLFKIKQEYFKSLNISTLPYYIDFEGYPRLTTVLKNWRDEIRNSREQSIHYYDSLNKIDKVL